MELTAHRTLALREAIGRSPDVALTLLLLKLVTDTFRTSSASGSCLEVSVRPVYMSAQAPDLKDSVVAKLVDELHAEWEADLPLGDDAALWDYLTVLEQGSRLALLAHCLSFGVNAGSGWLPEVLRRNDLVALDGEDCAEGQGVDVEMAESVSEADLPAFLTNDLPAESASMLAAE